ncbi:MAG: hypothetical protein HQM08_14100 [Candidatus Riflebacteria bacterium]|nr:hypothetical protein [Candidatus Riflebacteria bacterium]
MRRENALFAHLMLKAAGIPNRFVYARMSYAEGDEDQAFTVVEHDGESWVISSYDDDLNGHRVRDLTKPSGPLPTDPVAPLRCHLRFRRIERINDYPIYWIPRAESKVTQAHSLAAGLLPEALQE